MTEVVVVAVVAWQFGCSCRCSGFPWLCCAVVAMNGMVGYDCDNGHDHCDDGGERDDTDPCSDGEHDDCVTVLRGIIVMVFVVMRAGRMPAQ